MKEKFSDKGGVHMEENLKPLLLKPSQVAQLVGLGRSRTYELIRSGRLPSIKIGKSVRVPLHMLEEWVIEQYSAQKQQGEL
jgi:excisionase family DNA binding protein